MRIWLVVLVIVVAACGGDERALVPALSEALVVDVPPAAPEPIAPIIPAVPPLDLPVAGWLIDGAGAPIAGVTVTIDHPDPLVDQSAVSEADGAFRLAPFEGTPTVKLDAAHVFPAELRWQPDAPAPRVLLTRRVTLEARVTAAGAPVANAEVSISDGSSAQLATARTDADGKVRFADLMAGHYELWAHEGGRVSPLVRAPATANAPVSLVLGRGGRVTGALVADAPLPAGAAVLLAPLDLDHATRVVPVDATGAFALDAVPPGRWRVEASAPGFFQLADDTVTIGAAPATLEVRLSRAGTVRGNVVDATGAPVVGATLVLRAQGAGVHGSVADVSAVATRAIATSAVRWTHPLAGEPRQMPGRDARRFGAPRPGARPAECGRGHCGVDLGGKRGVTVHAAADGVIARVVREIRKESGRYVMIEHAGGLRSYYMHLDAIRGDLDVGQPIVAGEAIGTVGRTGVIKNAPHLHFSIAQERDGRTSYLDPEPILRHAVVLPVAAPFVEPGTPGATRVATLRGDGATPAPAAATRFLTDAHGAFRLDGVEPGEYVAAAFHPDLAAGASAPFRVRVAETTDGVVIMLSAGVVVHGRVFDDRGVVAGARVTAEEGFGETSHKVASTYTDANGDYELRALSGSVTVHVDAAGHGAAERGIFVGAATPTRLRQREDFELTTEDARAFGEILDPDGHPIADVVVKIVEGPTLRRRTVTDARGRFAIERLARGRYVVELTNPAYPPTRVPLTADTFAELRLEQGGSLSVELRDGHTARGLAAQRITASGPGGRTAEALTDARGFAELRGLTPGAWTLRTDADGYVDETVTLDVRPGRFAEDVRVEVHRGATVAGVVYDAHGERLEGARVAIGGVSTTTDRDGNFRLVDVPTGAVELDASFDDARGGQAIELRPGDEILTLQITVSAEP